MSDNNGPDCKELHQKKLKTINRLDLATNALHNDHIKNSIDLKSHLKGMQKSGLILSAR